MRFKYNLSGLWYFQMDPEQMGKQQQWFLKENYQYIEDKFEAPIPGCWEVIDNELADYKGWGWYFTEFTLPHEFDRKKVQICFEGVNYISEVYMDGKLLGEHEGGFTSFSFDVTGIDVEVPHYLVIRVENDVNFSGIHRDVYLEFYDWIFMEECKVSTEILWKQPGIPKRARISVKTYFKNTMKWELKEASINHILTHDKALIMEQNRDFNVQNENSRLLTTVLEIPADSLHLWSPSDPYLYDLKLMVKNSEGVIFENLELQVGIREFKVENDKLMLNGKEFEMKGVAKQFEHPDFGLSLPKEIVLNELKKLKERGINTIRLIHHPADTFTLTMMDRLGFGVIEEIGMVDMTKPQTEKMILEMIDRDRNHPCIFSWNMLRTDDKERSFDLELQKQWYADFEVEEL